MHDHFALSVFLARTISIHFQMHSTLKRDSIATSKKGGVKKG